MLHVIPSFSFDLTNTALSACTERGIVIQRDDEMVEVEYNGDSEDPYLNLR